MNKQKFKVGDRVRIAGMNQNLVGRTGTITEIDESLALFRVRLDKQHAGKLIWWCTFVEHVESKKFPVIVITTDGKTTTATERDGKKVIKTATTTCSDKDTFDFAEGARVAFERLQGRDPFPKKEEKPERPEKLVCVKGGCGGYFKAGKVYGVKWRTGRDVFDFGGGPFGFAGYYQDGRYIAPSSFGNAEFIPLVED